MHQSIHRCDNTLRITYASFLPFIISRDFQLILVSNGFSLTNHEAQKLLRALNNTEWHAHLALSVKNFYGEIISWFMKEWLYQQRQPQWDGYWCTPNARVFRHRKCWTIDCSSVWYRQGFQQFKNVYTSSADYMRLTAADNMTLRPADNSVSDND